MTADTKNCNDGTNCLVTYINFRRPKTFLFAVQHLLIIQIKKHNNHTDKNAKSGRTKLYVFYGQLFLIFIRCCAEFEF